MKLFSLKIFKRKEKVIPEYDLEDLKKIKKKNRKKSLKLLQEYKKGLFIEVDKDINHKKLMEDIRKNEQILR